MCLDALLLELSSLHKNKSQYHAEKAIDGITGPEPITAKDYDFLAHTDHEVSPYFQAQFAENYWIIGLKLWLRTKVPGKTSSFLNLIISTNMI